MNRYTVGIDLGASYAKIAYRLSLKKEGSGLYAEMESDVVIVQGVVTVPTVVIMTGDSENPFIAGPAAAKIVPRGRVRAFENWKARFYSDAFDASKVELVTIAGQFFSWLSKSLRAAGLDLANGTRVRVTIPGVDQIERQQDALQQCMRMNGWPEEIEVVLEPIANLLGVISDGRNVVSSMGKINYSRMFGTSENSASTYIFDEMRQVALKTRNSTTLAIAVIDCGSFTLDVARVDLDLKAHEYSQFPVESVKEESWELGVIDALDNKVLPLVCEENGISPQELSFEEKESAKRKLYSDDAYSVSRLGKLLGATEVEQQGVTAAIEEYCEAIWVNAKPYIEGTEVVVITGGGVGIPSVREFLSSKLSKHGREVIFPSAVEAYPELDGLNRTSWQQSGMGLDRLATCLGAASVGLGFTPSQ